MYVYMYACMYVCMAAMVDSDATESDGDRTILVDITHFGSHPQAQAEADISDYARSAILRGLGSVFRGTSPTLPPVRAPWTPAPAAPDSGGLLYEQ